MNYSTFSLEQSLLERGYSLIAGIDEAGRGCLAGPVVAAVVVVSNKDQYIPGVWDSKIMTLKRREDVYDELCETVEAFGIGSADAGEIDELGIGEAASLAMRRAYGRLEVRPEIVFVDGARVKSPNFSGYKVKFGDSKHYVISAASVIAKVHRDRFMRNMAERYPGYGFERHVGYGTREHLAAIAENGATAIHRRSYSPIKKFLRGNAGGKE